jgi:hypothetical protein
MHLLKSGQTSNCETSQASLDMASTPVGLVYIDVDVVVFFFWTSFSLVLKLNSTER